MINKKQLIERFIKYVTIDTESDPIILLFLAQRISGIWQIF